ncbi:MAG: glycosyltransferase [Chthoniobacterales bacterium]
MTRKRIIVMGFMASCPVAGVVWQHIHYIVGLQRLGHDVYYIEDSSRLAYNPNTREWNVDFAYAARLLQRLASEFGFEERWGYCARFVAGDPTAGLPLARIRELYREADAILNVCGAQEFNDDLLVSDRLIYIDSDPGLEQIMVDLQHPGARAMLQRHHALFSFGENVGTADFPVPTHGLRWLPTRQPVVTDFWQTKAAPPAAAMFTTVANLSTSGKDIEWRGENYLWSKAPEFRRFVTAPTTADEVFEIAVNLDDDPLRAEFQRNSWRLRPAESISVDHHIYCDYIANSKGEFTVAKDQYVRLHSGWFSDRSACYLAAGRPVITQETGFTQHYGDNGGLFAFSSLGEIAEAVKMINADYARHSRAARELALEFFEAEKVLRSLLERAGV